MLISPHISTTFFICSLVVEGQDDGDLRLVGGNYPSKGRLEIYHNSTWGTICDDGFTTPDANVACRQLGYRTSSSTSYMAGGGTGPIWLDDMSCDGTERRIDKCSHRGWNTHDCGHGEDVGVRCTGEYDGKGVLGSWSIWTRCSSFRESCFQTRNRLCNNPVQSSNRLYCNGKSFEVLKCSTARCRVNGNWGSWSSWTTCSASCDSGFKTRHRDCNNPVPSINGSYCNGKSFEVLKCTTARCRVDGSWGSWSIWSVCNATRGGCVKKRKRNCNNPCPSAGGSSCSGIGEETLLCATSKCPVNGGWTDWQVWSICSFSCGSGIRKRTRLCDNPPPSYGGRLCNGNTLDLGSCNTHACPVDGDWSGWSSWNICSATCDGGIQDRTRKCDYPQPSKGGIYCKGTPKESRPCHNLDCEIDGQWGSWQEWEICNTTCGNGTQQRIRKCDSPSPYFGGSECIGLDFDIQTCYQDICPDIQLQSKEDTPNSFSSVVLGAVAIVCIVVTAALTCITLFVFHRFRPSKNSTRNINGGNSESLAELQHDQRGYDRPIRASGIQINVYDTINNENNVSDNTQFIADSMNTGEHANILCNATNIETSAHANSPCNAENIETGAHAKIPCNADNVDHVYENLKIF